MKEWKLQGPRVVDGEGGTVALLTNPLHGAGEIMDWPRHGHETENATAAHLSAEANGRLIIAAPIMLRALEDIATLSFHRGIVGRARAAIKAARGDA